MDWSLPGSSVHGICQARVLEWGAIALDQANKALDSELISQPPALNAMLFCQIRFNFSLSEYSKIAFACMIKPRFLNVTSNAFCSIF